MSTEYKGNVLKDKVDGDYLKDKLPEGDVLTSEGPKGTPLWRKNKLNEDGNNPNKLNE